MHQFATFNRYNEYSSCQLPTEKFHNLPFNMNTFNKLWGGDAIRSRSEDRWATAVLGGKEPENLEEQAISLWEKIFTYKLIKGYTGSNGDVRLQNYQRLSSASCRFVIIYDNNYFNDTYRGFQIGGYIEDDWSHAGPRRISKSSWMLISSRKDEYLSSGAKIVFTGMIDEFFDYELGTLEYRSLRFETEVVDVENYQGNAVVNYTDRKRHTLVSSSISISSLDTAKTVITREYPADWKVGDEPYYPVNNKVNNDLYAQYKKLAQTVPQSDLRGRLGQYRYYDMHHVIAAALETVKHEFE